MRLLDGQAVAKIWLTQLREIAQMFLREYGRKPALRIIRVSQDHASVVYTKKKSDIGRDIGIDVELMSFNEDMSSSELEDLICGLNVDQTVDGMIVQLPLPPHLDVSKLINLIDVRKDVDGLSRQSMGALLAKSDEGFVPCTPQGVLKLLQYAQVNLHGCHVVMVGGSLIVGRPMAILCLNHDATITICNSKTRDLAAQVAQADVLIVGIGRLNVIEPEWIKPGAVVIDVGINRGEDNKLVGDVPYKACHQVSHITPVPGGVGPMTVASLMHNTMLAACRLQHDVKLIKQLNEIKL